MHDRNRQNWLTLRIALGDITFEGINEHENKSWEDC